MSNPTDEREQSRQSRPRIICLCGSSRFIETFAVKTWELEREGFIVLGCTLLPLWYCPVPDHFAETLGVKAERDEHHLRKIDLADELLILNVNGYIGESTRTEIIYAETHGKPVKYLEPAAAVPCDAERIKNGIFMSKQVNSSCTCGSARPNSARFGLQHLSWCRLAEGSLRELIWSVVTGDANQIENLDMTEKEWTDAAGKDGTLEITVDLDLWLRMLRAAR